MLVAGGVVSHHTEVLEDGVEEIGQSSARAVELGVVALEEIFNGRGGGWDWRVGTVVDLGAGERDGTVGTVDVGVFDRVVKAVEAAVGVRAWAGVITLQLIYHFRSEGVAVRERGGDGVAYPGYVCVIRSVDDCCGGGT